MLVYDFNWTCNDCPFLKLSTDQHDVILIMISILLSWILLQQNDLAPHPHHRFFKVYYVMILRIICTMYSFEKFLAYESKVIISIPIVWLSDIYTIYHISYITYHISHIHIHICIYICIYIYIYTCAYIYIYTYVQFLWCFFFWIFSILISWYLSR